MPEDPEIPEAEVIDTPDLTDPVALEEFVTLKNVDEFTRQWRGFMDMHPTALECVEVLQMFDWLALTPEEQHRLAVCVHEILQRVREGSMGDDLAHTLARYLLVPSVSSKDTCSRYAEPTYSADVRALVSLVCQPGLEPHRAELTWLLIYRRHRAELTDEMWEQMAKEACVEAAKSDAQVHLVLRSSTMQFRPTSAGVVKPVEGDAEQFELDILAAELARIFSNDPNPDDR